MARYPLIAVLAILLAGGAASAAASPAAAGPHCTDEAQKAVDYDCDDFKDDVDNCPTVANFSQTNTDGDRLGDACDLDDDEDGVQDQADSDGDGYGDRAASPADNCRLQPNPGQEDGDRDGVGDACSADTDADGVPDGRDNCPSAPNPPPQADADADAIGDACDADRDGDSVSNELDNCPDAPNPDQRDRDANGRGAVCDPGEPFAPAAGPAPAVADTVAPGLTVTLSARQRRSDLLGGMPARVRCSEACGLTAELEIDRASARRLRLRATVTAAADGHLGARGSTYLIFRLRHGVARQLRLLPRRGVTLRLRVVATDPAGNRTTRGRRLRLLR